MITFFEWHEKKLSVHFGFYFVYFIVIVSNKIQFVNQYLKDVSGSFPSYVFHEDSLDFWVSRLKAVYNNTVSMQYSLGTH